MHLSSKLEIILATDASGYGIGAVLLDKDNDGRRKVILRTWKTLLPAEKSYSQIAKQAGYYVSREKVPDVFGFKGTIDT